MRTPESTPTDPDQLIRFGSVASVDLAAGRCVVTIDEEGASGDATTPPIRWIEPRAGATRTWSPPSVGEQVVLLCPAGEIGQAVALRGVSCNAYPPAGNSLAELVRFDDGAVFSYDPEAHALSVKLPAGATIEVDADGGIAIKGDIALTGKLTASDDVAAAGKSLKSHKHGGVQTGTGQTGAPL
ncbi:phage baseplate assembly protein V [Novosphingobium huizhouense]|uniref:phage baseplate assembly protein V n=1 Tax=Novosphingobium huizhouense TaxID=2866625 RepID=UPI001CD89AFC|nr:phage baseplate assembly protein V [Novosphingobium huizhouense]